MTPLKPVTSTPHMNSGGHRVEIGLLGSSGRMGQWVNQLILAEFSDRAVLRSQAAQGDPIEPLFQSEVVIDFSSPTGMSAAAEQALHLTENLPAFVVGSTGWDKAGHKLLETLAQKTPVLLASNFSTGVFVFSEILRRFSPLLKKTGYSPSLVETHHQHKKDSPSGTALSLQRAIAPEKPESISTHSIRAGTVIGDHEVTFYGHGDKITLAHSAQDRSIFARGAIEVALWLVKQRRMHATGNLIGNLIGIETYFESIQKEFNI